MPRALFVLQNPWRRGRAAKQWDGPTWETALWQSQTGKRLREYIPEGVDACVINANPVVADNIRTVRPPDRDYVLHRVAQYEPDVLVLLGRIAQDGLRVLGLGIPVLCFPHPCWRLLSKQATAGYRKQIVATLLGGQA